MTIIDLLAHLDGVKPRGSRWSAKCPAHADRSPSLSVSEGDKGVLLRCWAGCNIKEICAALKITEADLFFDALDSNPQKRRVAAQARERQRQQQAAAAMKQGQRIDALREADDFIRSRSVICIDDWSDQKLNDELMVLADAYQLLELEESRDDIYRR